MKLLNSLRQEDGEIKYRAFHAACEEGTSLFRSEETRRQTLDDHYRPPEPNETKTNENEEDIEHVI